MADIGNAIPADSGPALLRATRHGLEIGQSQADRDNLVGRQDSIHLLNGPRRLANVVRRAGQGSLAACAAAGRNAGEI